MWNTCKLAGVTFHCVMLQLKAMIQQTCIALYCLFHHVFCPNLARLAILVMLKTTAFNNGLRTAIFAADK